MNRLTALVVAALPALAGAAPQDRVELKWKLPSGHVAEFEVLDRGGQPVKGSWFWVFGHELREDGTNRIAIDRYIDLPSAFLFHLPKDPRKKGEMWEHTAFFFHEASLSRSGGWMGIGGGSGGLRPVCAKGRYVLRKTENKDGADLAHIDGQFTFYEIRRDTANNQVRLTVTKTTLGTIAVAMTVDTTAGMLREGRWQLDVRGNERRLEKNGDIRVMDTKVQSTGGLRFAEDVELTREKMEKAAAEKVKTALGWLKRQQTPGGDFGTGPTLERMSLDADATPLALRALVAAGEKPDGPEAVKAVKAILARPKEATQTLGQSIAALVLRHGAADREGVKAAVPKSEASALKALQQTLANRRTASTATWASSEERGAVLNPISTAHALEGLWTAGLAGFDTASDVWKLQFDTLSSAVVPDDGSPNVELKLGFAEGFGFPLADGPKESESATWKYDIAGSEKRGGIGGADVPERGWAFTVLGALQGLRLAQIELERTKSLTDSQKRPMDRMMRQGFAWLLSHRSLRTPLPTEGGWSPRRVEHLYWTARTLQMYGIETFDGADWWIEMAYQLLRMQFSDGRWDEGNGNAVMETAMAILTLTRAWPAVQ